MLDVVKEFVGGFGFGGGLFYVVFGWVVGQYELVCGIGFEVFDDIYWIYDVFFGFGYFG